MQQDVKRTELRISRRDLEESFRGNGGRQRRSNTSTGPLAPDRPLAKRVGSWLVKKFVQLSSWTLRTITESSWFVGLAGGKWPSTDYLTLARKAFWNAYAGRALWLLGQLLSSLPVTAQRVDGDGNTEAAADHPFFVALRHPNSETGYQSFVIEMAYDIMLGGEVLMWFPDTELSGEMAGKPGERGIELIRPFRLQRIEFDEEEKPKNYHVSAKRRGGRRRTIPASRIFHVKTFNPFDPDRGLPLLIWCLHALELMEQGDEWNLSVAAGRGKIPGYISWKPPAPGATMDDEQWNDFKTRSNEQWEAAQSSSKPFYLGGDFTFQEAAHSPADADFQNAAIQYARQICVAIGFDPALLGDAANKTYSNMETALKAAFLLTVAPMMEWVLDELNARLMPRYTETRFQDVKLAVVRDEIEALSEDKDKQHTRLRENVTRGIISIDEMRRKIGEKERGSVASELTVLFNRVLLETIKDAQPMTLSNSAFDLSRIDPDVWATVIKSMLTGTGVDAPRSNGQH